MSSRNIIDLRGGTRSRREAPRREPAQPKEKRPVPLRVRRRRTRLVIVALLILALGGAAYGVHSISYLPRLSVGLISVTGTERMDPALIQSYVDSQIHDGSNHFLSRANIFLYPKAVIEKGITASFPRVQTARIIRTGFSQTLNVAITERKPFAEWCSDASTCYALDESGFIFSAVDASSTSAFAQPYVFSGGVGGAPIGQIFIPGHMTGLLALLRILQQQSGLTPVSIRVENDQDITIHFAEGFDLKASFGEDAAGLARNLQLVLSSPLLQGKESELEYIDLRFGNRVYYKLKGQDQAQQ